MTAKVKEPSFNLLTTRVTDLTTPKGETVQVQFKAHKGRLIAMVRGAKISHQSLTRPSQGV